MGNDASAENDESDDGIPENFAENAGRSPIHKAASNNNATFAFFTSTVAKDYPDDAKELLLRRDGQESLPLHHAISVGQLQAVTTLIQLYKDYGLFPERGVVNEPMKGDISPLHIALKRGYFDIARVLVNAGAAVDVKSGPSYPLHIIVTEGAKHFHMGVLELINDMIARGADVNSKNNDGETPLMAALSDNSGGDTVLKHREEIILHLLENPSVQIDVRNGDGFLPIHTAALNGFETVVSALVSREHSLLSAETMEGRQPLLLALEEEHTELARKLIELGADVNSADKSGHTALSRAVQNGELELAKEFLTKGANANAVTSEGPILNLACAGGNVEMTKMLLEHGVDATATSMEGRTALHALAGNSEAHPLVALLVEKGADINAKDGRGFSPLYIASGYRGNEKLVEALIQCGADVKATTNGGATALHAASHKGLTGIMELLIGAGADVNATTTSGRTPFMLSREKHRDDAAALLLLKGATNE